MSIKEEIYNLLKEIAPAGVTVRQSSQGIEATIPALTFSALNTDNTRDLDGNIICRNASIQIDVWGDTSPEASQLETIVEEALRQDGWGMSGSQDVPDPNPQIYHKTLTFDTIKV